ncbi:MAG: NADH-quinone oxidoreductase subunit K [Bacteroidales bacterium]|nr:NADH-quinone oxidoreductase subunit K [Bacteroidales bacterium]
MDSSLFQLLNYGVYGTAILVMLIGLYGALVKKSLLKVVIGLSVMESGLNLLIVALGYLKGGTAPIFSEGFLNGSNKIMVDPVPQALVLTAIVIGFGVTAVALSLVIRLYRHHGTLNIDEIRNLKW